MRTTWEKIVHHFGTIYGHEISNKPHNKEKDSIPNTEYTEDVQSKHRQRVELLNLQSERLSEAIEAKRVMLTQAVKDVNYPEAPIKLDIMENEIDEETYKASIDTENQLTDDEKIEHDNAWRTYRERTSMLQKQ